MNMTLENRDKKKVKKRNSHENKKYELYFESSCVVKS